MASRRPSHELEPAFEGMITLDEAKKVVEKAERQGYVIRKPANPHNLRLIKQAVHAIIAERLIQARNASRLNNDKINRMMVDHYIRRRRKGKAWTFTNALSERTIYLADEEEVEILSKILNVEKDHIGIHLTIIPWALADQQARRDAKPPRTRRKKNDQPTQQRSQPAPARSESDMHRTDGPPDYSPPPPLSDPRSEVRPPRQKAPAEAIPLHAGDLKITHSGLNVHVHGKVWCSLEIAQKLRMIVPLKLINQAKGDDPWSYEINGPVHAYQLYNLMHVLYGAPRVTAVQMD